MARILITGGAGFVGSNLALSFKEENHDHSITVLDNLKRRGSELNLTQFKESQVEFVHGDIRISDDFDLLKGEFDLIVDASAEPSVLAGLNESPRYLLDTNLAGTLNCLEFARKRAEKFIFLSTSRVYSIAPLKEIQLWETDTRFEILEEQIAAGISVDGVSEGFPTHLPRSLYGATKLASEMMIQEYVHSYGMGAVINRCGVIAGPGQFGKVDQGVFTHWVASHFFGRDLQYTGFGGTGKQVRDLLHPNDLFSLIRKQVPRINQCKGEIFNVGGGKPVSVSMRELTRFCQEITGNEVPVRECRQTSEVDIPLYISDFRKAEQLFDWKPTRSVPSILEDIHRWITANEQLLRPLFT